MTYKFATTLLALNFISCQFQLQGDNCDMTKSSSNVNAISIQSWDKNAKMWNELMGEGSSFQLDVVDPVLERMLPNITSQMKVIEIGCGNGFLARRFAKQGATIYAFDSSEVAISLANGQTSDDLKKRTFFEVLDITRNPIPNSIGSDFDIVISNMALMDIAEIGPVFSEAHRVLKRNGVLIVTQTHPCFEKAVGPIFHEVLEKDGMSIHTHGVKVSNYLSPSCHKVRALPQLPSEHLFFHRPLSEIIQNGLEKGFVIDKFEEAAFPQDKSITEHNGWHSLNEIPVIVGIRFRKS